MWSLWLRVWGRVRDLLRTRSRAAVSYPYKRNPRRRAPRPPRRALPRGTRKRRRRTGRHLGKEGSADRKDVAAGGEYLGDAAARTAAMERGAEAGRFPRTPVRALGRTEITSAPERVVVRDTGELDDVVPLGSRPVGHAPDERDDGIPTYLRKDVGTPESGGMGPAPEAADRRDGTAADASSTACAPTS